MPEVKNLAKRFRKLLSRVLRRNKTPLTKVSPFKNWLKEIDINTILDVGAHKGESARKFHKILPNARIYSFEPQLDCFTELNIVMKDIPNFQAFNFALGEQNQTHILYRSSYSPSSSLLPMGKLHKELFPSTAHITSDNTVEVRRLDDLAMELDFKERILLKMDTQGYESRVLNGGISTLLKVSVIITEVLFQPLYEEQTCFADIYDILSNRGFIFCGVMNPGRKKKKNGIPLFSDVLFIRKELL